MCWLLSVAVHPATRPATGPVLVEAEASPVIAPQCSHSNQSATVVPRPGLFPALPLSAALRRDQEGSRRVLERGQRSLVRPAGGVHAS